MLLFTILDQSSSACAATFAVPLPATGPQITAKLDEVRENFATAPIHQSPITNHAKSWGGPVGYDSGADYARN